jgi:hypothetical protein
VGNCEIPVITNSDATTRWLRHQLARLESDATSLIVIDFSTSSQLGRGIGTRSTPEPGTGTGTATDAYAARYQAESAGRLGGGILLVNCSVLVQFHSQAGQRRRQWQRWFACNSLAALTAAAAAAATVTAILP